MRLSRFIPVVVALVVFLCPPASSWAKDAAPLAKDSALEKKVEEVSAELRCLVCQNQTIADSHAALAVDLKNQVREMMREGQTKDEVVNYMVQRYGDFVRYKPPMKPETYFLWFGPALLIILGVIVLMTTLRRRNRRIAAAPISLSNEESNRVAQLLSATNKDAKS